MRGLVLLLVAASLGWAGQPRLATEPIQGVERAVAWHAESGELVSDENPAMAGEMLHLLAETTEGDVEVWVGGHPVPATRLDAGWVEFRLPHLSGGSFVEIFVVGGGQRSNTATLPLREAEDGTQLTAAESGALVQAAAMAIEDARMAIAVVDRAGRPLALFRRPQATDADVEKALSLARTAAFFSHNQAPLSSRTVLSLSTFNFPAGIPNQPAAALYGIENTNRGCNYNTVFAPGKFVPRPVNASGTGTSLGITTQPGGLPLYRNGEILIGGIGVALPNSDHAEFAAVAATAGTPFFVKLPLPAPGAVYVDGFRLPYVNQTERPAGTAPASEPGGVYQVGPRSGNSAPEGWLVEPRDGQALSAGEVRSIIERSVERAGRTRAVIRLPLGSRSRMVIAVADLDGQVLGVFRMPDATFFSIDVAITKARNVVYFSSPDRHPDDLPGLRPGIAVTNRTIGFGAQPLFPSGILNSAPGPFFDLYRFDLDNPCTQGRQPANPYQSGIVFFPGSSPLYKGGRLAGGLGVSGDGVEQDDYVTAGGAQGFEAPDDIRSDQFFLRGVRMPYWKFPRNPEQ